ncbi:hypothetical protein [Citricoccus muralis]|nr:hypothetical protein [Citricoccus muralis]
MTDAGARVHHFRLWSPAVAIVSVAWLVFWRSQQIPVVCALAFPCPDPNARIPPALIFGALMLVPLVVLVMGSYTRQPAVWLSNVSYVALAGLAVLGYGAILFAGGFTVDLWFLLCSIAILGTIGIAGLGIRRNSGPEPLTASVP